MIKKFLKHLTIIVFICFSASCTSIKSNEFSFNEKAKKIFLKNFKSAKKFKESNYVGSVPTKEVLFLQKLTKIKSDSYKSFEEIFEPSEQNLIDWKAWYEKNKDKLYWDKNDKMVKIRDGNVPN